MSPQLLTLEELFLDRDSEFKLTLRRAEPDAFFRPSRESSSILAERRDWLRDDAPRYAIVQEAGAALVNEFAELASGWKLTDPLQGSAHERLLQLGGALEPDLLFLTRDSDGEFRLRAGALCFPTGWALSEKLGETMEAIHGVVPGLNAALGPAIHSFLAKLKPGVGYLRHNWGLAATDALNLHPARRVAAPELPVSLAQLWLRVEYQVLLALPQTQGIVFGIRIGLHRLDALAGSKVGAGLKRSLESMSDALAAYKRIERIRKDVINRL